MAQIKELETVVDQIDRALLKLSNTPEEGHVLFDVKGDIKKLLYLMPGQSEYYINKIVAFYWVFKDLLEEAAVEWSIVERIDDENYSILWKMYRQYRNRPTSKPTDDVVGYDKDAFEEHKAVFKVGYKTTPVRLSKFNVLLERVNYEAGDNQVAERIVLTDVINQCIKLIEGANINLQKSISLTFEEYVGWIAPALKESTLEKEIIVRSGDVKINWNAGPAVLGYLMDELDRNGYQSLPYGTNKKKNAEYLLTIYHLKTSVTTLAIELSENTNSLVEANKRIVIKPIVKSKQ